MKLSHWYTENNKEQNPFTVYEFSVSGMAVITGTHMLGFLIA